MYDRILVPLDGTAFSEQAIGTAIAVARRSSGAIFLATVEVPPPATLLRVGIEGAARSAMADYLDRTAERVSAESIAVSTAVLKGPAADMLERHRNDVGATLTVMATHGRAPAARAWLGSVTDQFVRWTTAPTLLVRPEENDAPVALDATPSIDRILVTLDGSALSEAALAPALELARLFDAALSVTRLVVYPNTPESVYLPDATTAIEAKLEEGRAAAERELVAISDRLRAEGVEVRTVCRVAMHAAEGILEVADDEKANVIAMATHGRGGVGRLLLGSVTDKVLRATDRTMLIVHPSMD